MSALRHTPGPWRVWANPEVDDTSLHVLTSPSYESFHWDDVLGTFPWHDEGKANALLVAAAPELLGALRWAMEHLAEPIHGDDSRYGREHALALAIVAKAEGAEVSP